MNLHQQIAYLNQQPFEYEILSNEDGSQFIPIWIVEALLSEVDPFWNTDNFKFQTLNVEGVPFVSASIEMVLHFGDNLVRRTGATTFQVVNFENVEAVALAEATKNAAKKYGSRLGKDLNGRNGDNIKSEPRPIKEKKKPVLMSPDIRINEMYSKAVVENNAQKIEALTAIYDFSKL